MNKGNWTRVIKDATKALSIYLLILTLLFVGFYLVVTVNIFSSAMSYLEENPDQYAPKSLKTIRSFEAIWRTEGSSTYVMKVGEVRLTPPPKAVAVENYKVVEVWQYGCYPNCSIEEINGLPASQYTVEGLFDFAKDCLELGSSVSCEARFDEELGYPTYVSVTARLCLTECAYGFRIDEILLNETSIPEEYIPLP